MNKFTLLNTRPTQSLAKTRRVFEDNGFEVIDFPCIEITAVDDDVVVEQLKSIRPHDSVIFTSQHAVGYAYKIYPELQINKSNLVITVGVKTSELLEQHNNADIWVPAEQNSQGVIELLKGLKTVNTIHLITAAHGRNEIQQFAEDNGITLKQINVYQRVLPQANKNTIEQISQSKNLTVLATSVTTLDNLKALLPELVWQQLLTQQVLCASKRIEDAAIKQGFAKTLNSQSANPKKMANYLIIEIFS